MDKNRSISITCTENFNRPSFAVLPLAVSTLATLPGRPGAPDRLSLWINTMNRWIKSLFLAFTLACATLAAPAQTLQRTAPRDVLPGRLVITQPPEATLDGQPVRLSPGARIRDLRNLQVLSGALVGQNLPVVYKKDTLGLVHEAWILTEDEYATVTKPAPTPANPEALKQFFDLLSLVFLRRPW